MDKETERREDLNRELESGAGNGSGFVFVIVAIVFAILYTQLS